MANRDFPCYSSKQMYHFLTAIPINWDNLQAETKTVLSHFADCNNCSGLFSETLYRLASYGLLTPECNEQGNKTLRETREEIEKEKRSKLAVNVELYKDTGLVDLSTLLNFKNITILVCPTSDTYYNSLEFCKILIDDTEVDIVDSIGFNAGDYESLTKERLEEIIRQYKELT